MKKHICEHCGSKNLKARIITYPMKMGEKQINIGRVSVRECLDCNEFIPTEKGKEKIERTMMFMMDFMLK